MPSCSPSAPHHVARPGSSLRLAAVPPKQGSRSGSPVEQGQQGMELFSGLAAALIMIAPLELALQAPAANAAATTDISINSRHVGAVPRKVLFTPASC